MAVAQMVVQPGSWRADVYAFKSIQNEPDRLLRLRQVCVCDERSWQLPCCCAQPYNGNTTMIKSAKTTSVRENRSIYMLCAAYRVPVQVRLALRR